MLETKENIYGHQDRLNWIVKQLKPGSHVLEFGCGTGYMITCQLLMKGFNVCGIDLDQASIEYGQIVFCENQLEPKKLVNANVRDLNSNFDVIIASEVLEHVDDNEFECILKILKSKLNAGGMMLVTVPNGYGCFEIENFIWTKLRLGKLFDHIGITRILYRLKKMLLGHYVDAAHPSTLSSSPHLQRFTYSSIQNKLKEHDFEINEIKGTVLFAGPLSNIVLTGFKPIMRINLLLGSLFPRIASGFLISCHVRN